jgi:hypothetical protein
MQSQNREARLLPYGRAKIAPGEVGEPAIMLRPGVPLRLSDGPYPFPEPPDLIRIAGTAERLELLREHLQSLCGLWDRPARLFLDAYFRFIDEAIATAATALAALAARGGGLFAPADWSFTALRPLPQAQLLADSAAPVRADFAFWTGDAFVVIELQASANPRRQRQEELARLAAAGIAIIAVPATALQQQGERLLVQLLPPPFHEFWRGVTLPTGPFGPELGEIVRAV